MFTFDDADDFEASAIGPNASTRAAAATGNTQQRMGGTYSTNDRKHEHAAALGGVAHDSAMPGDADNVQGVGAVAPLEMDASLPCPRLSGASFCGDVLV